MVKTEVDETDMDIDSGSGPIRRSKRQAEKAKNREDTDVKMKLEVKEEETKSSVTTEGSEKLVKKDESEEVEVDAKPETAKVAKSKSKKGQKKRKRQSTENSETMQDPPVTVATDTEKSNSTRGPFRQCDMEVFAAFPKNVLCNIASNLSPEDVLTLARTCKPLRKILMSKQSKEIWVAARDNEEIEMPDPPEEVSEPKYVSLYYTDAICCVCHALASNESRLLLFPSVLAKLCKKCQKECIKSRKELKMNKRMKCKHGKHDEDYIDSLLEVLPVINVPCPERFCYCDRDEHIRYFVPFVDKLLDKEKDLEGEEWEAFLEDAEEKYEEWAEQTTAFEEWDAERERKEDEKLRAISHDRMMAVYKRLEDKGWHRYFFAKFSDEPESLMEEWAQAVGVAEPLRGDEEFNEIFPTLRKVYNYRRKLQNTWEKGKGYKHDAAYYRNLTKIANSPYCFGLDRKGVHPSIIEYDESVPLGGGMFGFFGGGFQFRFGI